MIRDQFNLRSRCQPGFPVAMHSRKKHLRPDRHEDSHSHHLPESPINPFVGAPCSLREPLLPNAKSPEAPE